MIPILISFLENRSTRESVSTFPLSRRDWFNYIVGITLMSFQYIIKTHIRLSIMNNNLEWRLRCSHEISFRSTRTFNNFTLKFIIFYLWHLKHLNLSVIDNLLFHNKRKISNFFFYWVHNALIVPLFID